MCEREKPAGRSGSGDSDNQRRSGRAVPVHVWRSSIPATSWPRLIRGIPPMIRRLTPRAGRWSRFPPGRSRSFDWQAEDVARHAGEAKVLVFVNPSNPTGGFVEDEGTRALARVAVEKDLTVIADEIYEDLVYDGKRVLSLATCDGMLDRTVTLSGLSKSYAMTGFRVGYLIGDSHFIDAAEKIKNAFIRSMPVVFPANGPRCAPDGKRHSASVSGNLRNPSQRHDRRVGSNGYYVRAPRWRFVYVGRHIPFWG